TSQMTRVFVSLTGTGCGTTLKDCRTGHRFGQTMQFVFFPDPLRFGWTLLAGNYLLLDCPATTPWVHWKFSAPRRRLPITTTRGLSGTSQLSKKNLRYQDRNRTRISPTVISSCYFVAASASQPPARSRTSKNTAPISSLLTHCPNSCQA